MAIYYTLENMLKGLQNNLRINSTETGVYGDSTLRTAILNNGAKDFIRRTRALKGKDTSITSVTSTAEYSLSGITTFMMVDREGGVLFDSTEIPYKSMRTLTLEKGTSWASTTAGKPEAWYMRNRYTMGLYPSPSSTYNAKTITIFYIKRPADMSTTTDTPFDSDFQLEEYTEAPLLYATWKLLIRGRELEEAVYYQKLYFQMVKDCIGDLNTTDIENLKFTPFSYNTRR